MTRLLLKERQQLLPSTPQTEITISQKTMSLTVGGSKQLTATVTPDGTAVAWDSSNSSVATVDSTGNVTAVAEGTADITVSAGDVTATCKVTVNPAD